MDLGIKLHSFNITNMNKGQKIEGSRDRKRDGETVWAKSHSRITAEMKPEEVFFHLSTVEHSQKLECKPCSLLEKNNKSRLIEAGKYPWHIR